MDPHNDFDTYDRPPDDIYTAMRQERDVLRKERDELSERVGRYALEFETLTRRWIILKSSLGSLQRWRMTLIGLDPHPNGEWVRYCDASLLIGGDEWQP
jgi:hypothetical protein